MDFTHEYDFAVSYASPDEPFVEQVVAAMRARGLRVFFAPDEQADIVGRNLIDYLSEVYLTKARYCLVFISSHYAERTWTDRVERPAAQARAIEQKERYIIPVRLDDTKIPGMLSTTADIRSATPRRIADLAVAILLRDENPAAVSDEHQTRERLVIRVISFTEMDVELLQQSFKPFAGWVASNTHMIPVELRLPRFLTDTIALYEDILESQAFQRVDPATQRGFRQLLNVIRKNVFGELLRAPSAVLVKSLPIDRSSLTLTDSAAESIRRYVLSKVIAVARCLATYQLKGFSGPKWASRFADCDALWSPGVMGGLPWLCRSEDSERHLWLDADITEWGSVQFNRVRIYLPSVMRVHGEDEEPTADKVLQFVIPQLLERALDGRPPDLLYDAFHYPERMNVSHRDENVIESHHFHEVTLSNFNWKEALPAMESLRDEIMMQFNSGVLTRWEAVMRMNSAMSALGHREVFLPALHGLYRLDGQDLNGANDV